MLNIIKVLQGASTGAERANLHDGRTDEPTNRNASKFGRSINLNFQPFFFFSGERRPGSDGRGKVCVEKTEMRDQLV